MHRCCPLRDRGVESAEIHLLKGFSPEEVRLDLPEQNEHRRRVLPRCVYPYGEVGCANSPRGHGHPRPPRQLAFRLGHKGGARLVARRDEGEVGVLLGGVQDLQEALAGHRVQAPHTGPRHNLGRDVSGRFHTAIRHPSSERSWPTGTTSITTRTSYTLALRRGRGKTRQDI